MATYNSRMRANVLTGLLPLMLSATYMGTHIGNNNNSSSTTSSSSNNISSNSSSNSSSSSSSSVMSQTSTSGLQVGAEEPPVLVLVRVAMSIGLKVFTPGFSTGVGTRSSTTSSSGSSSQCVESYASLLRRAVIRGARAWRLSHRSHQGDLSHLRSSGGADLSATRTVSMPVRMSVQYVSALVVAHALATAVDIPVSSADIPVSSHSSDSVCDLDTAGFLQMQLAPHLAAVARLYRY